MPELREKPKMEKPKVKGSSALSPKQAARVLSTKYERQLEQRVPCEENETEYATGQVERTLRSVTEDVAGGIQRVHNRARKTKVQWKSAGQDTDPDASEQPEGPDHPNVPKERSPTEPRQRTAEPSKTRRQAQNRKKAPDDQRRSDAAKSNAVKSQNKHTDRQSAATFTERQVPDTSRPGRQTGPSPGTPAVKSTGTVKQPAAAKGAWQASDSTSAIPPHGTMPKEKPGISAAMLKTCENVGAAEKISGKTDAAGTKLRPSKATVQALGRTRGNTQRQTARQMIARARKAPKNVAVLMKKNTAVVGRAMAKLLGSLMSLTSGGVLLVILVSIFVIGAVASSPFGIFFTQERSASGTVSVSEAVSTVNMAYNAKLEELQSGSYESIVINGQAASWPEVLAVFAVKTAGAEDGVDVVTLDTDRVQRLTDVFWDMTAIRTEVEAVEHSGSGNDAGWTGRILHITVTAKTADDMRTQYNFTDYQNSALDELLAERDALAELIGSLTITDADVSAILDALPDNLSPERRKTVEAALTLVGKVTYFWGGKSSAIGWDSRWGALEKVTAAGSPTTGTYRPYGLDCSGYVDWTFNNSLGYVIGNGGGVISQHAYCTDIAWQEAQPGDLAFYPDDSHIGIVVGRSNTGVLLVAHCSSGRNNVVVADCAASGFADIGKPGIFG